MTNDPNKGWRDGIIEQFESRIPPILKTGGKPCIPVSSFWSHTQESGKSSPPVSHFQACSMGEVFSNQEKTEIENDSEPLMGLSSIFVLLTTKQMIWGWGLGFIVVSIVILYFSFRAHARRQEKKRMIQNSPEKKETPVEFFKQEDDIEDDIGLDGAAYPPLQPIKFK